jgi:hypothetical protein
VALAKFDQVVMSTCHARQSRSANAVVSERTVRNKARGRRLTAMIVQGCGLTSFHMPFSILFGFILLAGSIATAKPLDVQAVNEAQWDTTPAKSRAFTTRAQILLARSNFSPGEIDGNPGENLDKAIAAFVASQGVATHKLTSGALAKTDFNVRPARAGRLHDFR